MLSDYLAEWRVIVVAATLLVFLPATAGRAGQREAMLTAWQKRQDAAKTIEASWQGSRLMARSYAQNLAQPAPASAALGARGDLVNFDGSLRFVLEDADRTRLEFTGKTPAQATAEPTPEESVEVVAEGTQKILFATGTIGFPTYYEKPTGRFVDMRVLPLLLALRPLDALRPLVDAKGLAETGQEHQLDGGKCLVFRHSRGEIWVDPDRDYVPVRYLELRKNRKVRDVFISYARHAELGWAPTAWNNVKLAGETGVVLDSLIAKNVRLKANPSLPASTFDVELPVGTWVNNAVLGESYILRATGRRPVLPGEFNGTNYQELLNSDPPSENRRAAMMAGAGCLFGVMVLVWLLISRVRKAIAG